MKKEKRIEVYNKFQRHCSYCGKKIEYKDMQVDHILPKRMGGTDDMNNLNPSCRSCNHYKRAYKLEDFRDLILTLHERTRKQYINKVAEDYGIIIVKPWDGKFYFEVNTDEERFLLDEDSICYGCKYFVVGEEGCSVPDICIEGSMNGYRMEG